MRIPGADQAIGNLVKWSAKEEWAALREQVFRAHLDPIHERCQTTDDELIDLLGDAFGMVFSVMFEDFLTARFGDEGEGNVIDDYLRRRGWREKVPAKRYLEALRDSTLSLYEVVDVAPGHSMTVRDLILGGDPVTVEEKLGSQSAARWDRIAGRLVTVNSKPYLTGGLLLFAPEAASEVLSAFDDVAKRFRTELRREAKKRGEPAKISERDARAMLLADAGPALFIQSWLMHALGRALAPRPEIRNTDGDEIVFSEVRFPILGDDTEVAAILDGIDAFERDEPDALRWTWLGRGSPSQRVSRRRGEGLTFGSSDVAGRTTLGKAEIVDAALTMHCNSKERAERARDLLSSHLGKLVGSPLTSYQDLETMLEAGPGPAPAEPELPPEVAEQVVHSYLDGHYREALDDPLPVLGGKTPRQAVKTKKGRALVVDWLKLLENTEFRRAAAQGQKAYDMSWMWRELRIEDARQ